MTLKTTVILGIAALAFSACDTSKTVTVNTANKSNTAVVSNTNTTNTTVTNTTTTTTNTVANTNSTTSADSGGGSELKIDDAGVAMTVPKGMNFSKEGTDTIVKTEDDGVDTRFTVLSEDNIDKAFENASKEIDDYITGAKFASQEPKKSTQNGLNISSWNGTGKAANGDDVQFEMAIVEGDKKPLLALTYAEAESMQKHQADLGKFFKSIRKQ